MKIEFYKSVDVEDSVEISINDITTALTEALGEAIEADEAEVVSDRTQRFTTQRFVNYASQCLRGVTGDMISNVLEDNRKLIATRLREEADRWAT